ncbi:MAG: hypothetical protein GEU75_01155 [Dehalococcoidia bacterium]|nr:hypothetical protein [Dehalococcoidia bacterium]
MGDFKKTLLAALGAGALALTLAACGGSDDDDGSNSSSSGNETPAATAGKVALDTAFGTGGIKPLPLSASAHDRFMATAIAPDGKIYGAGFITQGDDHAMAVARLTAAGALDTTFGTGGIASLNVAIGGKAAELARSVIIQSNGKVAIAGPVERDPAATGDAARDTDVAVVRFDSAGKPDATFGTNGVATFNVNTGRITTGTSFVGDNAWGMGGLAGDKIAVFGSTLGEGEGRTDTDFFVLGVTAAGALDSAFGDAGKVLVDGNNKSSDSPRNVLVQPDGKIVTAGYSNSGGIVRPVVIRLSSAGVLDSTFGANGVATAEVLPGVAEAYSVSLQGSDYVLAGYGRGADTAEKVDMIVYRFKANGSFDTSFGANGVARLDIAKEDDRARNVTVLPDGRILAVGSGKRDAANINGMIALFTKDGQLDSGFGEGGYVISDLGGPSDAWYGVALSPDKKFVIVTGYKGTNADSGGNDDAVVAKILL